MKLAIAAFVQDRKEGRWKVWEAILQFQELWPQYVNHITETAHEFLSVIKKKEEGKKQSTLWWF